MEAVFAELPWQFAGLLAQNEAVSTSNLVPIISRVVHILSAMILVGGLFYIRTILSPAGVDACFADRRAVWAKWVGFASALLIASGLFNFMAIVKAAGEELPPTYHMLFGIKFLAALLLMFVASILAGRTTLADRFRANMKLWLNLGWLAAVAIVVLAAILRTLH
ncbi:MAG: hypothetical protein GXP26_14600 [Planctomycetes bacterium]|nr:hypothetical protein [Planctomycetota bacterium]